jgi:hypothetical protein
VACGGGEAEVITTTTTDARVAPAEEFAATARRAIEGTRFEGLSDDEVSARVIQACDAVAASSDPDAAVIALVATIDAPEGSDVDEEIMAVVLAQGALTACPDAVDAANLRAWESADPEVRFLTAVLSVTPVLDVALSDDALVAAGETVCSVLDGGGTPEEAVVAEFSELFGTTGVSVDDIASGQVGEREGLIAGGVLASAASFLCPEHFDAVTVYLEALAEENAG